jgi:hypothetical protein
VCEVFGITILHIKADLIINFPLRERGSERREKREERIENRE